MRARGFRRRSDRRQSQKEKAAGHESPAAKHKDERLRRPGGSFRLGAGDLFVVEGDEYDTAYFDKRPKFLLYRPQVALLTSVEFDHADIYRDLDHYRSAFASFIALLPASGHLAVAHGSGDGVALAREARCPVETYGIDAGDWNARDLACQADDSSPT